MSSLVLTADQVAAELEYLHRDGTGNGARIRELFRAGEFPAPIDPKQPAIRWRWSRARVEQYVAGEWGTTLPGRPGEEHLYLKAVGQ